MRTVSKDQQKEIAAAIENLETAMAGLDEVRDVFLQGLRALLTEHYEAFSGASGAVSDAVEQLKSVADEVADQIQAYAGDRSEKWQESEQAGQYDAWASAFQGIDSGDSVTLEELITGVVDEFGGSFDIHDGEPTMSSAGDLPMSPGEA